MKYASKINRFGFLYLILILILKAFFAISSASESQLQDNPTETLLRLFFSCSIRFLFDFFLLHCEKENSAYLEECLRTTTYSLSFAFSAEIVFRQLRCAPVESQDRIHLYVVSNVPFSIRWYAQASAT